MGGLFKGDTAVTTISCVLIISLCIPLLLNVEQCELVEKEIPVDVKKIVALVSVAQAVTSGPVEINCSPLALLRA